MLNRSSICKQSRRVRQNTNVICSFDSTIYTHTVSTTYLNLTENGGLAVSFLYVKMYLHIIIMAEIILIPIFHFLFVDFAYLFK